MRIVIIDDQRFNIAILEACLRMESGLTLIPFEDPVAAVDWIAREQPDLVFVDYDMPGMDGLAVVRALRADADLADMPVVMVSGVEEKEIRLEALKRGANDFLAKPVDPIELRARTANMLRLRRRSLEVADSNRRLAEARERAEQALTDLHSAKDQLIQTEKLAALGALVAGVAHEINTPVGNALTSVTWIADHIASLTADLKQNRLRRSDLEEFLAEGAAVAALVRANVERTARIIQAFKQIAAEGETDLPRRYRLRDQLEDLYIAFSGELARNGARLSVDCPEEAELVAPPGVVARILMQLVQNAATHAFADRTAGSVRLSVRERPDGGTILVVADNGVGMDPATADRLFEPFFTTARGAGHIGLGMATVHNLVVRALGGEIAVATRPGDGTIVTLTLPPAPPGAANWTSGPQPA